MKQTITAIVALLLAIAIYFYFVSIQNHEPKPLQLNRDNLAAYIDKSEKTDPRPLQNLFLTQIKSGNNDAVTKTAAYWLSHRYFDNGGDIYEIINYINSHPELSFLQEAESIYPLSFQAIKSTSTKPYSTNSFFAYMAYLEVLEKKNLLALPGLSTLANKYIESAYTAKQVNSSSSLQYYNMGVEKSLNYAAKALPALNKVMQGDTNEFASINDAVVGLNQYASMLQYYKALGIKFDSPYTADNIYDVATKLSASTTLHEFTNYTRATSYVLTNDLKNPNLETSLAVIYANGKMPTPLPNNYVATRILKSFNGKETGVYSFNNTLALAEASPAFRNWLLLNGWSEQYLVRQK